MSGAGAATSTETRVKDDFYPTPAPAVEVLRVYLDALNPEPLPWLDPAAGEGAIMNAMPGRRWAGIELEKTRAAKDPRIVCADALTVAWPRMHLVANPPFSLLDEFWTRISHHRERHQVWCACLVPAQWWHAQRRAGYVKPDVMLALGWRPKFGMLKNGTQDYAWCILEPQPTGRTLWTRVERPVGAF